MACFPDPLIDLRGIKMIRAFALLVAAVTLLAGAGQARAESQDSRDIMGFGPSFFGSGASPIPRTTVNFSSEYAPGTIIVNTAERRLYLVLPNGQALRYGIGVGRDGFRWGGVQPGHSFFAEMRWTPLQRKPSRPTPMP